MWTMPARQSGGEEIDEVGAVHAEGGVPARRVGDLHRRDRRAVVAEVMRLRADPGAPFLHRGAEADALQMAHAVRREVDAGADLAERRGLLVDRDPEAVRDQRIGGEQAADAAADDRDVGFGFCIIDLYRHSSASRSVLHLFRGASDRASRIHRGIEGLAPGFRVPPHAALRQCGDARASTQLTPSRRRTCCASCRGPRPRSPSRRRR